MPIRISELRKETRQVDIEWDGETVKVEYRPGAVTAQMQMAAASMANIGNDPQRVVESLGDYVQAMARLIATWDILDDDGQPLPVTPELVEALPLPFVYAVFGGIMGAYSPNAKSAKS